MVSQRAVGLAALFTDSQLCAGGGAAGMHAGCVGCADLGGVAELTAEHIQTDVLLTALIAGEQGITVLLVGVITEGVTVAVTLGNHSCDAVGNADGKGTVIIDVALTSKQTVSGTGGVEVTVAGVKGVGAICITLF